MRYTFTIFIPTYNRAHLLPRALASIQAQTFRDFETVIVDDGSTDNTEALIRDWQARADFELVYLKQPNQGKYAAQNAGVAVARGWFFLLLDSDDRLLPDTLERILRHWESIPAAERPRYAGVEGLVESMDGQRVLTTPYPSNPCDISYLDLYYRLGIGGDKKHAIRTEILRRFPYPLFPGELNSRDSITWNRIAHEYIFRCVNESVQQVEYQPDGLTSNRFRIRMTSPRGFQLFFREEITLHRAWLSRKQLRRSTIEFIRFSLHIGLGPWRQGKQLGYDPLWLGLLPMGYIRWWVDLYRLRFKGGNIRNRAVMHN